MKENQKIKFKKKIKIDKKNHGKSKILTVELDAFRRADK